MTPYTSRFLKVVVSLIVFLLLSACGKPESIRPFIAGRLDLSGVQGVDFDVVLDDLRPKAMKREAAFMQEAARLLREAGVERAANITYRYGPGGETWYDVRFYQFASPAAAQASLINDFATLESGGEVIPFNPDRGWDMILGTYNAAEGALIDNHIIGFTKGDLKIVMQRVFGNIEMWTFAETYAAWLDKELR